jgi:tRNA(Ile2) C34 agmatinyltransferase TiaS
MSDTPISVTPISVTPISVTPMSVDENPLCKRCGFATEYADFVSAPPTLIYKCDLCGFDTRIAGKPETCIEPHGQQQQSPTKPEGQE